MLARFRPVLSATTAALRASSIRQLSTTSATRSDAIFIHRDTPENNPSIKFEFDSQNLKEATRIMAKYPP
ncbi:NADH:ubiquinone oxidoreductase 24, partial [Coemansia sp. RSA 2618]